MVYDATQPTNSTKIRNLGVVIRPNWEAIEQADASFKPYATNFANRTPLAVPNDPAAISNAYILYNKEDAHGNQQLYAIDQNSKIMQLTNSATPVNATNGYTWLPGGFLIQWGQNHANGGVNTVIPFNFAFTAVPYSIQITQFRSTGGSATAFYVVKGGGSDPTVNNFTVYKEGGGQDFMWMAIGQKV